jgi:hypothetical protein
LYRIFLTISFVGRWAHESGRKDVIEMLKKLEVSETRTDAGGKTPLDVSKVR